MKIYVPREAYNDYTKYSYTADGMIAQTNWLAYRSYIEPCDFEEGMNGSSLEGVNVKEEQDW